MIIGLIALYSASFENVRVSRQVFYDQLGCAVLGLILMYVISRIDYRHFYDFAYIIYALNVLFIVFCPGQRAPCSGRAALDRYRGDQFPAFRSDEDSRHLFTGTVFLASGVRGSFRHHRESRSHFNGDHIPAFWVGLSLGLIFKQPDLGTAIVVFGIFVTMLFAGGLKARYVLGFLGVVVAMVPFGWHF